METIYLISLIVGGFFVLLSVLGGDSEADADVDFELDADLDLDADFDADIDADFDGASSEIGAGPGFIDLFSLRALMLFTAFFGLLGTTLSWVDTDPTLTFLIALAFGLVAGLGGNYIIKRFGYAEISSNVTTNELKGKTGKVILPFEGDEKGKISLVVKGSKLQLVARSLDDQSKEAFQQGDEIVVVRTQNGIVEVVKPT